MRARNVLGSVSEKVGASEACQVHNPGYDVNDAALPIRTSLFARVAERKLAHG